MHTTKLCIYAIRTYQELSSIDIPYIKIGPASFCAHKQIMQLSVVHLSGVNCTYKGPNTLNMMRSLFTKVQNVHEGKTGYKRPQCMKAQNAAVHEGQNLHNA